MSNGYSNFFCFTDVVTNAMIEVVLFKTSLIELEYTPVRAEP